LNLHDWMSILHHGAVKYMNSGPGNASDVLSMKNTIIMHSYPDLQAGDITKNAVSRWKLLILFMVRWLANQ
jgi:hypothetical protein